VAVPEASVNKDHDFESGKRQIGTAGEVFAMKSVPVAGRVHSSPHNHFGARVFGSNTGHDFASGFFVHGVDQGDHDSAS
jgi:hypothetical protein